MTKPNPHCIFCDLIRGAAEVSICYEDAFGDQVMRDLPQAAFLVNVSNDGWFGD